MVSDFNEMNFENVWQITKGFPIALTMLIYNPSPALDKYSNIDFYFYNKIFKELNEKQKKILLVLRH